MVGIGALGDDWFVCRDGDAEWHVISAIPRFSKTPPGVQQTIRRLLDIAQKKGTGPATEKQISRLRYFDISFNESELTKGLASLLIEAFGEIDIDRLADYEERPCTAEQVREIEELGGEATDLTYCGARDEIKALQSKRNHETYELWFFGQNVNDIDLLDLYHYEAIPDEKLPAFREFLNQRFPEWERMGKYEFGELIGKHAAEMEPFTRPGFTNPLGGL